MPRKTLLDVKFDAADYENLSVEKQTSVAFGWLSDLTTEVRSMENILAPEQQQHVTTQVSEFMDHFQKQKDQQMLSKPVRNALGKLLQLVYTSESTKGLYEVANKLLQYYSKTDKYTELKHLAVVSSGLLNETCGEKMVSLAPMTAISLVKHLKNSTHTGFRYSCLAALRSVCMATGDTFDDALSKDTWKIARTCASDKSAKVASTAFQVMEELAQQGIVFKSSSDFDVFRSLYAKSIESPFAPVRQAAAKCFAHTTIQLISLSRTKAELLPKKSSKARKPKDGEEEEEDEKEKPAPQPASAPKVKSFFTLTFAETMRMFVTCYTQSGAGSRTRVGAAQTVAYFIKLSDPETVEAKYYEIANYLFTYIMSSPAIRLSNYKVLAARKHVVFIMNDMIGKQVLGEMGKMNAIKTLTNEVLKNYPAVLKDQVEPSPETLATTCDIIQGLVLQLGSAVSTSFAEPLRLALVQLLDHSQYVVQMASCSALKELLLAAPSHMISTLTNSLNVINQELPLLAKQQGNSSRIVGHAYLAAILVSLTNAKPEYSSLDLTSRVLTTATGLLKSNANVDVLAINIQVAWLLVSGLMPLGPSFVKIHLSQLLLLWKAALFKPAGKDQNTAEKSSMELSYHLHVRHCALGSIVSFLAYNSKLLTADVARRIGVMLQNNGAFLSAIPTKKFVDDEPQMQLNNKYTLQDYDTMTRRRMLQCYLYLSQFSHASEAFPANLLTSCLSRFADPDKDSVKLSTAIAAGSGTIDTLWEVADNNGYGVTSKINGFDITELFNRAPTENDEEERSLHWMSESLDWCGVLERQIKRPVLRAVEYDAESYFFLQNNHTVPAATAAVDLSIELFTNLLSSQPAKVQESILDQLRSYVKSAYKRNTGHRKNAVILNSAATVYGALKASLKSSSHSLRSSRILGVLVDIIKKTLTDSDPFARNLAAQAMGMVCSLGGATTTTENIKYLTDDIVNNRDPNSRGGSSIALGYILKHVGGMNARLHLDAIWNILVSLANDPHPTVHFWTLEAISITIASSGLSFSKHTSHAVSTLKKLYLLESHNDENSSTVSTNLDVDYPTTRIISRCVRGLINVFGPDLRESLKSRKNVLNMVQQFELSNDERIVVESYRSIQELIIFAAEAVNMEVFGKHVHRQVMINDEHSLLKQAGVDGLYQLIRTQPVKRVFEVCGSDLAIDVWLAYDNSPKCRELRRFIEHWLDQTGEQEPIEWIGRIQAVLLKTRTGFDPRNAKSQGKSTPAKSGDNDAGLMGDAEGESFSSEVKEASNESAETGGKIDEPLKWQTRELAIVLLRKLGAMMLKNKTLAQRENSPLVTRVGDLIKIAFSASTASVLELRVLGLKLLDEILIELKDLVDPDFTEVALLEQYQAQIGSALTPAFSADSSPELAFQAIKVCATFIGSGIIKNVDRMGRILKLLTSALESCSGSQAISLGELKCPSPNAQLMLRVAVLSLWAELQVSSVAEGKAYLVDVVEPHVPKLVPLWISSLRDFAKLRFEPEQSSGLSSGGGLSGSLDQMYSALSRSSILPIYQESWLQLVDAIASLIEQDSRLVFDILDEKERATAETEEEGIKYSNEPAAFFFVLFGLCFEALVRPQHSMGSMSSGESRLKVLVALKRILHPSVCGNAIYKDVVFAETIDMLDRIVLTGNVREQQAVVDIVSSLCLHHPGRAKTAEEAQSDQISESVDQLFELFRVVMLAITNMFPFLSDSDRSVSRHATEESSHLTLVRSCLDNLVSMIDVFPNIIKVDLYACLLYVFGRFLENEQCQKNIVPYSLVVQKRLLAMMMTTRQTCKNSGPVIEQAVVTCMTHIVEKLKNAPSDSEMAIAKRKNCILSAVIVLTTCADAVQHSTGQYLYDFSEQLVENISIPQLGQITSECTRTLLVSCIKSPVGKVFAERVIPSLVSVATSPNGESAVPRLVSDVLVGFAKGITNTDGVVSGLAIAIPVLIQFVGDKTCGVSPEQRLEYVKAKLLELVAHDGEAFKRVLQRGLSDWQRTLLEKILKDDAATTTNATTQPAEKEESSATHIQLKSFG